MNSLAYKKIELTSLLPTFNATDLDVILGFLDKHTPKTYEKKRKSLANIWSELNIDIDMIEQELCHYRNDISNNLSDKFNDIFA